MKVWTCVAILSVAFVIVFVLLNLGNTIAHERAHEQIAKYHGCVNGVKEYSFFDSSSYICLNYTEDRSDAVVIQEWELHSLNEIQGYTNATLSNSLLIGSFLMFVVIQFFGMLIYKKLKEAVDNE